MSFLHKEFDYAPFNQIKNSSHYNLNIPNQEIKIIKSRIGSTKI